MPTRKPAVPPYEDGPVNTEIMRETPRHVVTCGGATLSKQCAVRRRSLYPAKKQEVAKSKKTTIKDDKAKESEEEPRENERSP